MVSSTRRPHSDSKQFQRHRQQELPTSGRAELDSHADTIVLGSNCVILHHTGKVCEVSPYSDDYEAIKNVPGVCGATLWTDTVDNQEYILMFNESLWMGDSLTHSLINPNQLCAFGTEVQDNPFSTERLLIQPASHDITIPLQTLGTIIYANTCAPTDQELRQHPHIALSSHGIGTHITFSSPLMMWRRRVEPQSTPFKCDNNIMLNQVLAAQSTTQPHLLNGSYHRYKSMTQTWTRRMCHLHKPSIPKRGK